MNSFYQFITIFETDLIKEAPKKIISDPVKIEIFKGARTYKIPKMLGEVFPIEDKGKQIIVQEELLILEGNRFFIVLTARTKEDNPYQAQKECEDEINVITAMLAVLYSPDIFKKIIYKGWLSGDKSIVGGWIKFINKISLEEKYLSDNLRSMKKSQNVDKDMLNRFKLMSRFYSKALLSTPFSEEKFLWLWTILEIYPMKNTSNIKSISELLSNILKKDANFLKERLSIGKLFDVRSNLVHNGKLIKEDLEAEGFFKICTEFFGKLEPIVSEILRAMSGLEYSGSLDKYLK